MLKNLCYMLSMIILMAWGAGPAMALSIGATINAGTGESMTYNEIPGPRINYSKSHYGYIFQDYGYTPSIGGGLVIDDEKPGGKYIHRYTITLDRYSIVKGSRQDLYRFSFVNTFCFVLSKNEHYKFWLGPQVGVRYIFGRSNYNYYDNNPISQIIPFSVQSPMITYLYAKEQYGKVKYNMAGLDLGIVAGLNVDIQKYVTLSTTGGLRYGATAGGISFRRGGLFQNNKLAFSHGYEGFLDFSILYQFNTREAG
jgi:hypothetical protein